MAHLFKPQPSFVQLPVFFNVDAVVGAAPAQNNREDVLLVQFCFQSIGAAPRSDAPAELTAAAKAVTLSGTADSATISAIRALQKATARPSTVIDGRVSPAKGGYSYGGSVWSICHLNNLLQDRFLDCWPRLDKIPGCPQEIVSMVMRTVVGK